MALAGRRAVSSALRRSAPALVVVAFVVSIFFANQSSARSGYPFLEAAPAPAPDIVYIPTYLPTDMRPVLMTVKRDHDGSVDVEIRSLLGSGDELRVWESTRYEANVSEAVGLYHEGPRVSGALTTWGTGQTQDRRANLLHARVGSTLVVIVGALTPDELLRIADSLRRSTSSALNL